MTEPEAATTPAPDRIVTVPNALSVLRLALIPVFVWLLLVEEADGWAFAVLMFSGFSDWADGKIARLLDQSASLPAMHRHCAPLPSDFDLPTSTSSDVNHATEGV